MFRNWEPLASVQLQMCHLNRTRRLLSRLAAMLSDYRLLTCPVRPAPTGIVFESAWPEYRLIHSHKIQDVALHFDEK
jgi:hypothetical protein